MKELLPLLSLPELFSFFKSGLLHLDCICFISIYSLCHTSRHVIIIVHCPCDHSGAQGRKNQAKPPLSSASSFQVLKWEQGQLKKETEQILASLYLREKID